MKDWTDREIIEEMNFIDSEGYTKPLNSKWHSPRWWNLYEELRSRHREDWDEWLRAA